MILDYKLDVPLHRVCNRQHPDDITFVWRFNTSEKVTYNHQKGHSEEPGCHHKSQPGFSYSD